MTRPESTVGGASDSRDDLEAKAKKAVEVADFVLVCFDNQAQQIEEFRKVAAWVESYNKPIIAVLNVRTPSWRIPERVPTIAARERQSTQVRQHVAHITAELGKIGLPGVPVVAMSSQRALFARGMEPFLGPGAEERETKCRKYGKARLLKMSNFNALGLLLTATIGQHAEELRLGVLRDQLRGEAGRFTVTLEEAAASLREKAEQLEDSYILPMLRFVGYPKESDGEKQQWFAHEGSGVNLLFEVEELREGKFTTEYEGTFHRNLRSRVQKELGRLRVRSLRDADRMVDDAFDNGLEVTEEVFAERCLDPEKVNAACTRVLEDAGRFLERETELLAETFEADLSAASRGKGVGFEGQSAKRKQNESRGLKIAGLITGAGAATALTIVGIANPWNPVGWAIMGVALVSSILGWWGKGRAKKAKEERLAQRRKAYTDSRKAIHGWYDEQTQRIEDAAVRGLRVASRSLLALPLAQQLVFLRLANLCDGLSGEVDKMRAKLPPQAEPVRCLQDGMRIGESRRGFGSRNANQLWLGEDWIQNPTGLKEGERIHKQARTKQYDPNLAERMFSGLRRFFQKQDPIVREFDGTAWIMRSLEAVQGDEQATQGLTGLMQLKEIGMPEIYFVGDYNAGKSSLIKRLLIDEGCDVPEALKIGAGPTTSRVASFEWKDSRLVDTPGFQSGNEEHAEKTLEAYSKASWVVYVFHPNLVLGDEESMNLVLNGSEELGMIPKKERTLFLINCADLFGCDPPDAPLHFATLVENKKLELQRALKQRGIEVSPDQVLCIASDPGGLMGDQTDQGAGFYDAHRSWDGIKAVVEFFRSERKRLRVNGVDRSMVEGGVHVLARSPNNHEIERGNCQKERIQLEGLAQQVDKLREDGGRLLAAEKAKMARTVEDFVDGLIDDCMAATGPKELERATGRLNGWVEDPRLADDLERLSQTAAQTFQDWNEQTVGGLERRLESKEFQATEHTYEGSSYRYRGPRERIKSGKAVKGAATVARRLAARKVIYDLGKQVGYKFRPWEAVKISKGVAKAGVILVWVGVVLDGIDFIFSEIRESKEEKERKRLREGLRNEVPKVVKSVGYGDAGDEESEEDGESEKNEGLLKQFSRSLDRILELGGSAQENIADLERKEAALEERILQNGTMIEEAKALLGNPWSNEPA